MALTKEIISYVDSTIKRFITTSMNRVVQEAHTHPNKPLLDTLTSAGTGTLYLADDGLYKPAAGSGVTSVTATTPLSSTGGATPDISISQATAIADGYLSSTDWSTFNGKQDLLVSGTNIKTINSNSLLGSGNLTISASPSGLSGEIQFNNAGSFGSDSNLFWDNTNKRLGIGATPSTSVRLDVRSQGALSTDIAFRIRNSANTANLLSIAGNGEMNFNGNNIYFNGNHASVIDFNTSYYSNSGFRISLDDYGNNTVILTNRLQNNKINRLDNIYDSSVSGYYGAYQGYVTNVKTSQFSGAFTSYLSHSTSKFVIGSTTAGARLDVRAQGALSTDVAFRVRNSADNSDLFSINGVGMTTLTNPNQYSGNVTTTPILSINQSLLSFGNSSVVFRINETSVANSFGIAIYKRSGTNEVQFVTGGQGNGINTESTFMTVTGTNTSGAGSVTISRPFTMSGAAGTGFTSFFNINRGSTNVFAIDEYGIKLNSDLYISSVRAYGTGATLFRAQSGNGAININAYQSTISINNLGIIPTTSATDYFHFYASDIVAGNCAPHFRTENGSVIKLYQETTAIGSSAFVQNTGNAVNDASTFDGYTIAQIVKALRTQGLLA